MKQCRPKNSMFGICEIAYFPCQPIADLMIGCAYKLPISQLLLMYQIKAYAHMHRPFIHLPHLQIIKFAYSFIFINT